MQVLMRENLRNKSLKILFVTLFVSTLSCSKVKISDGEWCGDAGKEGAYCFHTLSDGERDVPKEQWDLERFGMICTKSENFAQWKSAILKLCKHSKVCKLEVEEAVNKFTGKVERIVARRGKK